MRTSLYQHSALQKPRTLPQAHDILLLSARHRHVQQRLIAPHAHMQVLQSCIKLCKTLIVVVFVLA
jgi:hypothetical protein